MLILLLLGLASSVYGYLTGASFLVQGALIVSPVFDVFFIAVFVVSVYATVVFAMQIELRGFQWLSFSLLALVPVTLIWTEQDLGANVRFYVAPAALVLLIVFSVFSLVFCRKDNEIAHGSSAKFTLFAFVVAGIGALIYIIKNSFNLVQNDSFAIQYLLSMMCVVLPCFYLLMALKRKLSERNLRCAK